AELSGRGFIATTFTGNMPSYDIVVVDKQGGHALVQVKAIAGKSWQLDVGPLSRSHLCDGSDRTTGFGSGRSFLRSSITGVGPNSHRVPLCLLSKAWRCQTQKLSRFTLLFILKYWPTRKATGRS